MSSHEQDETLEGRQTDCLPARVPESPIPVPGSRSTRKKRVGPQLVVDEDVEDTRRGKGKERK